MWQRAKPATRLSQYYGMKRYGEIDGDIVSLRDTISVGVLALNVTVEEVMDAEAELLCYRY